MPRTVRSEITWDLGEDQPTDQTQLDSLSIWLYAGDGRNFSGQIAVSKDDKTFKTIPGTLVKKEFPVGKDTTKLLHRILFTFAPGEVKEFRFLRLDIFGFPGQICQIQEVDAQVRGAKPKKYTDIHTTVRPLEKVTTPSLPDQTATPPMRVHALKFTGDKLTLAENGINLLNLQKVLTPADKTWKVTEHKTADREISSVLKRADGLTRTCRLVIDKNNRVNLEIDLELPASAAKDVPYQNDLATFCRRKCPL